MLRLGFGFKKLIAISMALWLGIGGTAYAAARLECASMKTCSTAHISTGVEKRACHESAKSAPCQCSIKVHSSERSLADRTELPRVETSQFYHTVDQALFSRGKEDLAIQPFRSPPPAALYQLYSALRI